MQKLETAFLIGGVLAAVSPNEEMQVFAGAVLGALISSLAVSRFSKVPQETLRNRFAVHGGCAILFGPFLTFYAHDRLPNYPLGSVSLACSGLIGLTAVSLINLLIPAIIRGILAKFNITLGNGDKTKNAGDPNE